ncbi:biliverdin-producing heme oxygenase [Pseudomonas sp. 5Ae-yellow]|uniref:biliverdin-producing heme oxygenase n=1 Tax=Pseudomonas sp. 5Ae-yellow TaxID=2759848 RepID=UPI0015F3B2A7|nr:biliverdin-producing heme oxygenase [Pseudomonas sp. 5Ae-yellow]MBA6421554.1 biliverdin-producing heme oxygenase [Pseudomonas sp. 5Ae-yellow]
MITADNTALPLSSYLKEQTTSTHESLDRRIMALAPFSNRERFACFLRMQLRLHYATAPLYQNPALQAMLPGLAERNRLDAVQLDCADFNLSEQQQEEDRLAGTSIKPTNTQEAIGWLYTHEGSTLGAAFLLKYAKDQLGLSESFGARHLAGHTEGRGLHWRQFKQALDNLDLTPEARTEAVEGARAAFAFVRASVEELMADNQPAAAV